MKKIVLIVSLLIMSVLLASCGNSSDGPLTEAEQAASYGMSVEEFKQQKDAAARMNMSIEDHLKMSDTSGGMDSMMDMSDDSSMIEDDNDTTSVMPEWAHRMPDGTIMNADGSIVGEGDSTKNEWTHMMPDGTTMSNDSAMSADSTHTMDDGTVMTDSEMHMEMMHEGDDIEEHGSGNHGDHG